MAKKDDFVFVGVRLKEGKANLTKQDLKEVENIKDTGNLSHFVRKAIKTQLKLDYYKGKILPLKIDDTDTIEYLQLKEEQGYEGEELAEKGIELLKKQERGELANFNAEDLDFDLDTDELKQEIKSTIEKSLNNLDLDDNSLNIEEVLNNTLQNTVNNFQQIIKTELNKLDVKSAMKDVLAEELPKYLNGNVEELENNNSKTQKDEEQEDKKEPQSEDEKDLINSLKNSGPKSLNL